MLICNLANSLLLGPNVLRLKVKPTNVTETLVAMTNTNSGAADPKASDFVGHKAMEMIAESPGRL